MAGAKGRSGAGRPIVTMAAAVCLLAGGGCGGAGGGSVEWVHLSSSAGELPPPGTSTQQTAALVLDVDADGVLDFAVASRDAGPSLAWFGRDGGGWRRHAIEAETLPVEAGGAVRDVDGDGDDDIVLGGDYSSNRVWWWENPHPRHGRDGGWRRWPIKASGENKHHDMVFGDFDGDGRAELAFWNQHARRLWLAEVPASPRQSDEWRRRAIYAWDGGDDHEGLAAADIDGDGVTDLVGGGRWFRHAGDGRFVAEVIDDAQRFSRVAVGDLVAGGRPEVVMVAGDAAGPLRWYRWRDGAWRGHRLGGGDFDHGHSLAIADVDGDGALDVFAAEMRLHGGNDDAGAWLFFGDGAGGFRRVRLARGIGNHESRLADLDGDGDIDILGKPYDWDTPRLDIWLNGGPGLAVDRWRRHVIDGARPWRSLFVDSADVDGDGDRDVLTGAWWYANPGRAGGAWRRAVIGAPLDNLAAVADFDGDGDPDVLGTGGGGALAGATFAYARNDGGRFTVFARVAEAEGDFLQGVAVGRFDGGARQVALSWHAAGHGVQRLTVPGEPGGGNWPWRRLTPDSQDEGLSAGDIDRDGDLDLLLGTWWLRNDGDSWHRVVLAEAQASPDRNRLADVDGDGRLDAVVGFEAISAEGDLVWYGQPDDPLQPWRRHLVARIVGPMSLDVADMDRDGDADIVVGEHHTAAPSRARLFVYENIDGAGGAWRAHVVHVGDEHHDGARVADMDGDGDPDIVSIGWSHDRVLLYENLALDPGTAGLR